jgi:hypothetical protein
MTRNEITEKTLREIRLRFEGREAPYSEDPDCEEIIVAELQKRLPETDIKICEDFSYLQVECCETCHELYPHYEMHLVDLLDRSKAWVCDSIRSAIIRIRLNRPSTGNGYPCRSPHSPAGPFVS